MLQDPINYDDYVFRIVPMLNYRQRNELEVLKESRNRLGRSRSRSMSRSASVGKHFRALERGGVVEGMMGPLGVEGVGTAGRLADNWLAGLQALRTPSERRRTSCTHAWSKRRSRTPHGCPR